MFRIIARHIAPPGMPSPVLWGDEEVARARLGEGWAELRMAQRLYPFAYPFGPGRVVDFFRDHYGPMARAFEALGAAGREALHAELTQLWRCANLAGGDATYVEAGYLEVVGVKG
jgi:hypothetical protein